MRALGVVFAGLVAAGCTSKAPAGPRPASVPRISRIALPGDALRGLSGLTKAPKGAPYDYLSVAERLHHLIPIHTSTSGVRASDPIPVEGVDPSLDLEGLAFTDDGRLIFSTEADRARSSDHILFAEIGAGKATILRSLEFPYEPWGITPDRNRGLEGVCQVGGTIVAASEMVREDDGRRWSPVGLHDPEHGWIPYKVYLTSGTGKISGLDCVRDGPTLVVDAIERHFDVLFLVRFRLEPDAKTASVERLGDLRPGFDATPPNFEGLARRPSGGWVMITDNDWRGVRGPTEVIRWAVPGAPPAGPSNSPDRPK